MNYWIYEWRLTTSWSKIKVHACRKGKLDSGVWAAGAGLYVGRAGSWSFWTRHPLSAPIEVRVEFGFSLFWLVLCKSSAPHTASRCLSLVYWTVPPHVLFPGSTARLLVSTSEAWKQICKCLPWAAGADLLSVSAQSQRLLSSMYGNELLQHLSRLNQLL